MLRNVLFPNHSKAFVGDLSQPGVEGSVGREILPALRTQILKLPQKLANHPVIFNRNQKGLLFCCFKILPTFSGRPRATSKSAMTPAASVGWQRC